MKKSLILLLFVGCTHPDPIEVCRSYCASHTYTIVRITTEKRSEDLYFCRCDDEQ